MAFKKTLKPEILQKCKESQQVINRLAYEYVKHSNTIKRWFETESVELTRNETLKYISEELNIKKEELCR